MRRKILPLLLTLGAVVGLGGYLWLRRDELYRLSLQSPGYLVLCALSLFVSFLVSGGLGNVMVHKLGKPISFRESLSLSVISTALNLFLPMQGGMAVRAVYLKRWHRFDYTNFAAMLFGCQVLMLLVCSLVAAAAVSWVALRESPEGLALVALGVFLCLCASVLAACCPRLSPRGHWFLDKLAAVTEGWHRLRSEPPFLAKLTGLSALQLASQVVSFWTACEALGVQLSFADALLVGTFGALTALLTITPGNLGIYEAAVAFVGAYTVNPFDSIMASLLARGVLLVVLLVLTPPAVFCLSGRSVQQKEQQPVSPAAPS
jgi:uncharacterized membrane protein YbhN (UPF0104 family)